MRIWNDLTMPMGKEDGFKTMVGAELYESATANDTTTIAATTLYVPLEFWFCKNPGLALPIISLQYHEVKFALEFSSFDDCVISDTDLSYTDASLESASLWIDYIYLDTDERRRTAQTQHEMLITQVQFTGDETLSASSNRFTLQFNHPCKELVWVCQDDEATLWNDFANLTTEENPVTTARLQLNGHERFTEREGLYFNYVQPFQHHERIPSVGVNVYSFALKPEEHQPSGTCNMSRIDTAVLSVDSSVAGKCKIFATNYNVLRIMSGMGGLAYAN
jgi:hypothetical protein